MAILHAQEVKQLLEQGQGRLEVKETLLQTTAMVGQRSHTPSAQLLLLAVLVGRLDDPDPALRSFAAQLLLGKPLQTLGFTLLPCLRTGEVVVLLTTPYWSCPRRWLSIRVGHVWSCWWEGP